MTAEPGRDVVLARAYLSAVAEPPAPALVRFVAEHGAPRAANLVAAGSVPTSVAEEVESRREQVRGGEVLAVAEAAGMRLLTPEHAEWPGDRFADLGGAAALGLPGMAEPLALWIRDPGYSAVEWEARWHALTDSVAIVGARAATGYGEHTASEFGHALGRAGLAIASGAAYGIDGAAHRGALAANQMTAAFLACGVDIDYPAGHGRLLASVAARGLVISEYPPGTPPRKHRFLVRNRLIAACGLGTLVVEAGARSGAANTVHTADALGRPVMAIPGPITSASSVGCHQMVRSGKAALVTSPSEVLELVSPLGSAPPAEAEVPSRPTDALDGWSRRIHDAVGERGGASAEQIAQDCGLPLRRVRALLPELEMSGMLIRNEEGWSRCPG